MTVSFTTPPQEGHDIGIRMTPYVTNIAIARTTRLSGNLSGIIRGVRKIWCSNAALLDDSQSHRVFTSSALTALLAV